MDIVYLKLPLVRLPEVFPIWEVHSKDDHNEYPLGVDFLVTIVDQCT